MRTLYKVRKKKNIALYLVALNFEPRRKLPVHFYFGLEP